MTTVQGPSNQLIEQIKIYLESVDDRPEKSKVAVTLWSLQCCIRCVWRLLHVRDITFYRKSSQFLCQALDYFIEKYAESEWQIKYKELPPRDPKLICPLCFGMLQKVELDEFQETLFTKFLNCGYEDQGYSLSITVPPSTWIRHYGMYYYLVKEFGEIKYWTEVESKSEDEGVPEIKEVMKWILGYQIFKRINRRFQFQSAFEVRLNFIHKETSEEYGTVTTLDEKQQPTKRHRSGEYSMDDSSATVLKRLRTMKMNEFLSLVEVPPKPVTTYCECEQTFFRASVFVAGRYFKFSREMSQTPWVLDSGERRTESSVTDIIFSVLKPIFQADDCRFSSAGREDVDVRMLGSGRPFVVEFINPRRHTFTSEQYKEMQQQINAISKFVAVTDLQPVSKKDVGLLQQGEDTKTKRYQCIVWLSKEVTSDDIKFLSSMKDLVIKQKTPIRVLHRRTAAVREKIIHSINCQLLDKEHILLDLVTQAGTYIKEFVHGDLGRTVPNVGSLLNCEADLLLLDCVGIDFDFPPKLSDSTSNFISEYQIPSLCEEWKQKTKQMS